MTSIELLDDLEAGELSVEFEGLEPWDVLEWALGRFGERLSVSTAFQDGDVALIDMKSSSTVAVVGLCGKDRSSTRGRGEARA